jgi:UDP-2,3-diacylglucosamine pyrophosphatase LpxH
MDFLEHVVHDAVIISDLHLGSDNCQAQSLVNLLHEIRSGELPTRKLILNGDVFDSMDFRRLNKHHWRVLSQLRKLSDRIEILWINGNHDGPAEFISHLLGIDVRDEIILVSGGRRLLLHHGHRFDDFIDNHPIITAVADLIYRLLQKVDRSHHFARLAKRKSKTFLRCANRIESRSIEYARSQGCDAVCCGHTHHAVANESGPIAYYNSGCWTEKPCHLLTVTDGVVALREVNDRESRDSLFERATTRPQLEALA